MKRPVLTLSALVGLGALAASPASAQVLSGGVPTGPGASGTEVLGNPSDIGITASTATRIRSSRREMNRGRNNPFETTMSPRETRRYARDLMVRAEVLCDVQEAQIVARTGDNVPVVEIDCAQGGGLIALDTIPIQATDCLDLPSPDAPPVDGRPPLACRLPGNVTTVAAARQSARN